MTAEVGGAGEGEVAAGLGVAETGSVERAAAEQVAGALAGAASEVEVLVEEGWEEGA